MSLELYIDDKLIDLSDQSRIGITYQANDIGELENRQGNFTNQFKLRKTNKNSVALGYPENLNSSTLKPYKRLPAKIIQDGIEIVPEGVATIMPTDNFYNIKVNNGNSSFFNLLNGKKLNQLDLSEYNHTYDIDTVVASFVNTEGYIYPNVLWNKTAVVPKRIPMVFIKTLFEKAASLAGFSLSGGFLDTYDYKNVLLSVNFRRPQSWVDDKAVNSPMASDFNLHTIISSSSGLAVYSSVFPDIGYLTGQIYYVPEDMYADFTHTVSFMFGRVGGFSACYQKFVVEIVELNSSVLVASDEYVFTSDDVTNILAGIPVFVTLSATTGFRSTTSGERYQVRMTGYWSATGQYYWTILTGSNYAVQAKDQMLPYLGGDVNFSEVQHDMLITDFMKGIMNMYCVVPQADEYRKFLSLNRLDEIEANKPYAKDWSSKIDIEKAIIISYRDDNYAQTNYFKYSNDSDIEEDYKSNAILWSSYFGSRLPEFYGSGKIAVSDENLDLEKDVVTLPFSASIKNKVPFVNSDYSIDQFTPRVMILQREYSTSESYASFFEFSLHPKSLSFTKVNSAESLIENNYKTISEILERYKKVSVYVKLNAIDISELDFMIPIYLDVHTPQGDINGYFYLNVIGNYTGEGLTKCELVRI